MCRDGSAEKRTTKMEKGRGEGKRPNAASAADLTKTAVPGGGLGPLGAAASWAQEKTQLSPASSRNVYSLPSHMHANSLQNLRRGIRKISRKEGKSTAENARGKFRKLCVHRQKGSDAKNA